MRISRLFWLLFIAGTIFLAVGCRRSARPDEAAQRDAQARALIEQQNYVEATTILTDAIRLNGESQRDSALGEDYLLLAYCQRQLGQYDSVPSAYRMAAQSFRAFGNKRLEWKAKILSAAFDIEIGQNADADHLAGEVASEAILQADSTAIYEALSLTAKAYHADGKYENEIRTLEDLSRIDSAAFNSHHTLDLLHRQVEAFEAAGQWELMHSSFQQWLTLSHAGNEQARAYFEWGRIQQRAGHADSALKAYSRALSSVDVQTDRRLEANILASLGGCAYRSRRFDDARRYFNDALQSANRLTDMPLEAIIRLMLVACDWKTNKPSDSLALVFGKQCEDIAVRCRHTGFRLGEAFGLFLQGTILLSAGDSTDMTETFRQALHVYEVPYTASVDLAGLVDAFLDGEQTGWYEPVLSSFCAGRNIDSAFALAERQNNGDIFQFFSRLDITTRDSSLNDIIATLQRKDRELRLLEADILAGLSAEQQHDEQRIQLLRSLFADRANELSTISAALDQTGSNFRWLLNTNEIRLEHIRSLIPASAALLEYLPLADTLYAIVAIRDSARIQPVPCTQSHILGLVREYNALIGDPRFADIFSPQVPAMTTRLNELSSILADILIDPILPFLANDTTLYIVPPTQFGWLPFHTLISDVGVVAARFDVSYLPTAAVLQFRVMQSGPVRAVLAAGHSGRTNWDVDDELRAIAGRVDSVQFAFGDSAALDVLNATSADLIHVNAEFSLDPIVPNHSLMFLADRKLSGGTIGIPLGNLLTISPKPIVFENISAVAGGFSRYAPLALLANGSPTVIAALWRGDASARHTFDELFYESLRAGNTVSQAYRGASVGLERTAEFSPAYRWGLFYRFGK